MLGNSDSAVIISFTVSPPVRTVFPFRPYSSLYGQRLSLDNFTQNKKCGQWPALNPTKKKIWQRPLQRPKKAIYIFFTQSMSTWSIYAAHKGTYSWGKSIWAIGYGSLLHAPSKKNWTILLAFWQDNGICCKNLAFKLTLICESRAWRGQIEKIRSLL